MKFLIILSVSSTDFKLALFQLLHVEGNHFFILNKPEVYEKYSNFPVLQGETRLSWRSLDVKHLVESEIILSLKTDLNR